MAALFLTTVLSSHNRDPMVHEAVKFHYLTLHRKSLSTQSIDQLFSTRPTPDQPPDHLLSNLYSRLYCHRFVLLIFEFYRNRIVKFMLFLFSFTQNYNDESYSCSLCGFFFL